MEIVDNTLNKKNVENNETGISLEVFSFSHRSKSASFWSENQKFYWLICLLVGQIAAHSTRTLMPICAVAISKEFSWNKSQMGAILSSFFWGYMLVQIFSGNLADLVGGEAVLIFGALGWSTITILYAFIDQLKMINVNIFIFVLFLRVVNGIFQGFHTPSIASLISNRVSIENRGLTFTIQNSGAYIGTIISGSIGSLLLHICGWKMCFIIFGILSILWICITKAFLFLPNTPSQLQVIFYFKSIIINECKNFITFLYSIFISNEYKTKIDTSVDFENCCLETLNCENKVQRIPWSGVLSSKAFWSMMIGQFAYGYSHFIILSWMPTYFEEVHLTSKGWIFNVLPWLVTIPFSIFGGFLSDKLIKNGCSVTFVRKLMESISQIGTSLFLHLLTYCTKYEYSLILMTLAVAFSGFHCSGIILNPLDIAPNHGGAIFGIMNMAGAFPGFLGVYISGFLLEYFKNWNIIFNHTSIICFLGCIVYLLFGSSQQII